MVLSFDPGRFPTLTGDNSLPKIPPPEVTPDPRVLVSFRVRNSVSFQIIPRPVGRLGLGSGAHVVGRLWSGPQVGAGGIFGGVIFR